MAALRGLFGGRLESGTPSRAPSSAGLAPVPQRHCVGRAPETAEELASLIGAARSAFVDAAAVHRQLVTGGEEGLTDAQLKRWVGRGRRDLEWRGAGASSEGGPPREGGGARCVVGD